MFCMLYSSGGNREKRCFNSKNSFKQNYECGNWLLTQDLEILIMVYLGQLKFCLLRPAILTNATLGLHCKEKSEIPGMSEISHL